MSEAMSELEVAVTRLDDTVRTRDHTIDLLLETVSRQESIIRSWEPVSPETAGVPTFGLASGTTTPRGGVSSILMSSGFTTRGPLTAQSRKRGSLRRPCQS